MENPEVLNAVAVDKPPKLNKKPGPKPKKAGEAKKDRTFLAMATDAPNLVWSTPLILTDRAKNYLSELKSVPPGPERLEFFQNHLEDEDEMLARDAYDEFAKAPYEDVIALKPKMNREGHNPNPY